MAMISPNYISMFVMLTAPSVNLKDVNVLQYFKNALIRRQLARSIAKSKINQLIATLKIF